MRKIDVSAMGVSFKNGEASEEASTLGLRVGEWPDEIEFIFSSSISMVFKSTGQLFMTDSGEDVGGVEYRNELLGLLFIIWND